MLKTFSSERIKLRITALNSLSDWSYFSVVTRNVLFKEFKVIVDVNTFQSLTRQCCPPPDETKQSIHDPFTFELETCNRFDCNIMCQESVKRIRPKSIVTPWVAVEKEYLVWQLIICCHLQLLIFHHSLF